MVIGHLWHFEIDQFDHALINLLSLLSREISDKHGVMMAKRLNQKYITGGVKGPHTNAKAEAEAADEVLCVPGTKVITVTDAN